MIDIHCHILPSIKGDDGARNLNQAIEMARLLSNAGFTTVIATPHCIDGQVLQDFDVLREQADQLQKACQLEQIPIQIKLGCEILYHNEILTRLNSGDAVSLADSRYVLIEMPMRELPDSVIDLIQELLQNGLRPIIAHPERNRVFSAEPHKLIELIEMGAHAQLNLGSLTGHYGSTAKQSAEAFMEAGIYQLVGSDLHHAGMPIQNALDQIRARYPAEYVNEILQENGMKILENKEIINSKVNYSPKPIIKLNEVSPKRSKLSKGKYVLAAIASVAILFAGAFVYADYKIQSEMEGALNFDLSVEQSQIPSDAGSQVTKVAGTNSSKNSSTQDSANVSSSGTKTNSAPSTTTGQTSGSKKLTMAEKTEVYGLVLSKLSPEIIQQVKELAKGGFTSEEKKIVKNIFYTHFTAQEQRYLVNLYKKGK